MDSSRILPLYFKVTVTDNCSFVFRPTFHRASCISCPTVSCLSTAITYERIALSLFTVRDLGNQCQRSRNVDTVYIQQTGIVLASRCTVASELWSVNSKIEIPYRKVCIINGGLNPVRPRACAPKKQQCLWNDLIGS